MSARSSRFRRAAIQVGVAAVALVGTTGCWEQWSEEWWPQMKWQRAVQPFEETGHPGAEAGFMPPEGTIPVGQPVLATRLPQAEGNALENPTPPTLASLDNGREQYRIFCAVCHGEQGLGDGPVAGPPYGQGPLVGVLPLAGPIGSSLAATWTDGHIFWVISNGIRRMPGYQRVPVEDRWDIVNYIRYLNGQAVAPPATAARSEAPPSANAAAPAEAATTRDSVAEGES